MILKLLLKIWPAITPIIIYCFWLFVQSIIKKTIAKNTHKKLGKIIEATYQEFDSNTEKPTHNQVNSQEKISDFSLNNKNFIIVLYFSFFIAIICFLFFAISVPRIENGKYVPAHIEDGKITTGKIIEDQN